MDASLDYRRFARDDKNKTTTYDVTNNSDISYKVIIDELPGDPAGQLHHCVSGFPTPSAPHRY